MYQVYITIIKCKRDLAAVKTMMGTNIEKRLLFLLFNCLILLFIDYVPGDCNIIYV